MQSFLRWGFSFCILFTLGCQAEQGSESVNAAETEPAGERVETVTSTVVEKEQVQTASIPVAAGYTAGIDYEVLPQPVPTVDASKVEVAEVFWYGCSHCYAFEPVLAGWAKSLPDDVELVRSPAMWDQQGVMERHARIYYTAKVLGVLESMHRATFEAMNLDKNPLQRDDQVAALFAANGVSDKDFARTFNSFGVSSSVKQAAARQRSYRVQGTPELIVNGKFRISGRMVGSQQGMLNVASYLIKQEQKQKP